MADKIKDDLTKLVKNFVDIKINGKYIIYFSQTSNGPNEASDLNFYVTNGVSVWSRKLDEEFLSKTIKSQMENIEKSLSYIDYLTSLYLVLRNDSFDLNHIVDPSSPESADLVEFKSSCLGQEYRFLLNHVKSSPTEIKHLLFSLFDKYAKLEIELKKLTNRSDLGTEKADSTSSNKNKTNESDLDGMKMFNINNNHMIGRKPGMSLINPLSKRRKAPTGVKFDDDENEDDND